MIEERHRMPEFVIPSEYDDGENSYNMYHWFTGDVGYKVEWDSQIILKTITTYYLINKHWANSSVGRAHRSQR